MKNSIWVRGLATLAVCALVLPVFGSPKHPVERPFKAVGVISLTPTSDYSGTFDVVGEATHLGRFVGNGTYELTGIVGTKVYMHVAVTWKAANGDTIQLDMPQWVSDYSVTAPSSSGEVYLVGGTGRFAHATGSFFGEISPPHSAPGVTQIITAEGTITY